MVKDHSDSKRGNQLSPLNGILFQINIAARFFLYALSHRQHSTYHGLCETMSGMRNSTMGSPCGIDLTTTELDLAPKTILKIAYIIFMYIWMHLQCGCHDNPMFWLQLCAPYDNNRLLKCFFIVFPASAPQLV